VTRHPGIYDRGTYWQVRVRYTDDDTGQVVELENRREDFDPSDPASKEAALQRAISYKANEMATIRTHRKPMSETAEKQELRHWLERYRKEVLLPHKDGLIPPPGRKATAAELAKLPAYSRGLEYRKGWQEELNWVERWLGLDVVKKAKFLSPERRAQVVEDQAFFRAFFKRDVLGLKASDFHGSADCLTSRSRDQKGGEAKDSTKLRHLAVISAVYRRARSAWGFEKIVNPIRNMDQKPSPGQRRVRPLVDDEWDTVWAELQNTHPTTKAFILFSRWSAVRRGEPSKLRWEDIKGWGTDAVVARLRETKTPVPGEVNARSIPLHPEAVAAIASLLEDPAKPPRTGWVFPSPNDPEKSMPGGTAYQAWKRARERAGLPPNDRGEIPTLHDLRHTRLSELVNDGLELPKMMSVSGHKDTRTALRYYHAKAEDVGAEILELERKRKRKVAQATEALAMDDAEAMEQAVAQMEAAMRKNPKLRRKLMAAAVAAEADED